MAVIISDSLLSQMNLSEADLRKEFALWMYSNERLSLNKAALLGGLSADEFRSFAIKRGKLSYYQVQDLTDDLSTLRQLRDDGDHK